MDVYKGRFIKEYQIHLNDWQLEQYKDRCWVNNRKDAM